MADKTGIPKTTLSSILKSDEERKELDLSDGGQSYRDIERTNALKEYPETRKKILKQNYDC